VVRIGVLAVQGAFEEHETVFERVVDDGDVVQVRRPEKLEACDGLVLPGGESTTIDKLLDASDLRGPLLDAIDDGVPVLATCAGAILLASEGQDQVEATDTRLLGVLYASIERNAFGRQRESFEGRVESPALGPGEFPGVFIRAPAFDEIWGEAERFAWLPDEQVVGVEQDDVLALTFHPELSGDERVHRYFVNRVEDAARSPARG